MHCNETKLILNNNNKIEIFDFDITDKNKSKNIIKIGDFKVEISNIALKYSILKAFILSNDVIYLYLPNRNVVIYDKTNPKIIFNNCKKLWVNNSPLSLLSYNKDCSIESYSLDQNEVINVGKCYSLWSYETYLIRIPNHLNPNVFNIGKVEIKPLEINEAEESYVNYLENIHNDQNFVDLFSDFMLKIKNENKFQNFIFALQQIDQSIIPDFINLLNEEQIVNLSNFDFVPFFDKIKPSVQSRILLNVEASNFLELIEKFKSYLKAKEERFKKFICTKCIESYKIIRAYLFCKFADFNLCDALQTSFQFLSKSGISVCLEMIESEMVVWNIEKVNTMSLLGRSFLIVGIKQWALACFLAIKDEDKVTQLLSNDSEIMLYAMRITRDFPMSQYSKFLIDLEIGC